MKKYALCRRIPFVVGRNALKFQIFQWHSPYASADLHTLPVISDSVPSTYIKISFNKKEDASGGDASVGRNSVDLCRRLTRGFSIRVKGRTARRRRLFIRCIFAEKTSERR